jgi:hypothetical protein
LLLLPTPGQAQSEPKPLNLGVEEQVSAEAVVLPLVIDPKKEKFAGECAELARGLGRDDLVVLEGGEEVPVLQLTRNHLPTHHLLLLDTSESMEVNDRLIPMLEAARAYVNWLLPEDGRPAEEFANDLISIAGFDDDLILYASPTALRATGARDALLDAIGKVSTGFYTTLSESLEVSIQNLQTLPERPVIILISDGADANGSTHHDSVIKQVNGAQNLTVFPIGLGLSGMDRASAGAIPGEHKAFLAELARASGGKFLDRGKKGGNLVKAFDRIRLRLRRELSLTYLARPFGLGANDTRNARDADTIVRDIAIEPREPRAMVNCVVSGFKPVRYVIRSESPSASAKAPPTSGSNEADRLSNTLDLSVQDIQRDSDPLWYYDRRAGQYLPSLDQRFPQPETKIVALSFPGSIAPGDAADVLRELLSASRMGQPLPTRQTMNGRQFLRYQEALARKIHDNLPTYQSWARNRMAQDVEREILSRLPPDTEIDPQQLAQVVNARVESPRPEDLVRLLSAWRGDILARDLVLALEAREANLLLETPADARSAALKEVDQIQIRWSMLSNWFAPPQRVRVVAMLVPSYDAPRDAFGFYRVVLPRFKVTRHAGPDTVEAIGIVPVFPYGLQLVRFLLGLPAAPSGGMAPLEPDEASALASITEALHTGWRVRRIDHDPIANHGQAIETASVSVEFEGVSEDRKGSRLVLRSHVMNGGVVPICLDADKDDTPQTFRRSIDRLGLNACRETESSGR